MSRLFERAKGRYERTVAALTNNRTMDASDFLARPEEVTQEEKNQSDLHKIFYSNKGSIVHKWSHYLDVYDKWLSSYRDKPFRMLEIGVSQGGSLRMWRRYFGQPATIMGIDINPDCKRFDGESGDVRIGSQADPRFLTSCVQEMGGVDVVLDDGSHVASHQVKSFEVLWPLLSERGIYICEDMHTAYWRQDFEGGYRKADTFMEFAKRIVDDMHADFHSRGEGVSGVSRSLKSVSFYNSMIVFEKSPQRKPMTVQVGDKVI